MAIKPIDLSLLAQTAKNVHEAIVAASKRARQVNEEMRIEFNQRIETIVTKPEVEGEEADVNPDQLKVSMEFEKRPKPTDVALEELLQGELDWRYRQEEVAPPPAEEEAEEEEEEE